MGSFARRAEWQSLQKICSLYDNNNNDEQIYDKCANMTIEIHHLYFRSQSMFFQNLSQVAEL
jgi:hypothetical protein